MQKITDFLEKYYYLWYKIGLCDITIDIHNETDDTYCYDMSGKNQVLQLFFSGSHDYFYAIWIGNHNEKYFEMLPVYFIDFDDDMDENNYRIYQCEGNFRTFMESKIKTFIETKPKKKYLIQAQNAIEDLTKFSKKLIKSDDYKLVPYNI